MSSFIALAIVVHLSNVANVPAAVLADAKAQVVRMFDDVDVSIQWAPPAPSTTYVVDRGDVIRLHVIEHETGDLRRRSDPVLGAAMRTDLGTRVAWVFYRRVESEALAHAVRVATVLACAIAHEIGHLLLPTHEHALSGLMRACWDDADFQRAARGTLRFSADDRERMRSSVGDARGMQ